MNAISSTRTKRRIAVITGSRAEYGLLSSTLSAIDHHPRLDLHLVVAGMHLIRKFGNTIRLIQADGWPIAARIPMQNGTDAPVDQARGLSRGVLGMARFLEQAQIDVVLVLGDRIEALAGALAGVTTGRFVAHIHGGDIAPGDQDEAHRHAITKLSHLHFPATRASARRIIGMGERQEHVHEVGPPGLDDLRSLFDEAGRKCARVTTVPYALVVQHPCGRLADREYRVMRSILCAVQHTGLQAVVVYPNSDRGHTGVVQAIREHKLKCPQGITVHRSVARPRYLRMLMKASVIVGNSSSGLLEAPLAAIPSVNVGSRQAGREAYGPSVHHCGESCGEIVRTIDQALRAGPKTQTKLPRRSPRRSAGQRIAQILAEKRLTESLRRKVTTLGEPQVQLNERARFDDLLPKVAS